MKNDSFGKVEQSNTYESAVKKVEQDWSNFHVAFWLIFSLYLGITVMIRQQIDVSLSIFSLILIPVLSMIFIMGYFAYIFTGKRSYIIYGALGFIWTYVIGIFIGYFAIKNLRNKSLKNLNSTDPNILQKENEKE